VTDRPSLAVPRSFHAPAHVDEVILRLGNVQADSARVWGTMTPHEMLCHLGDAFSAVLGDLPASSVDTWFSRSVVRWIALHTSLPWPKGVKTRPEVDPKQDGTKPVEFESDRTRTIRLLRRFASPDARCVPHPIFGPLTRDEWMVWGYRHVDHHLRQFGH
jgi:uncharacterized protein DUF1569